MSLTKVQTIGIETGISFTGVTTITSLNATQGANISISSPGVALTITQSGTGGYVQVGTSSTVAVIDNSGRLLVGVASTTSDSRAVFQGSSASATGGTNVYFQRGSTPASGDKLGLFAFADVHGKVGAEISAYADATWSLGDYPGRLVFSTTPDGSSTVTERLRIDDNGNLILDSDLDTYIHHPAADTLAVTTGGSERVRIDSSGRFGIGTNSPSTLIHGAVSSGTANLRLENTATSGEATIQLYGKNSGGTVRTATIKYDNADYFRIGTTAAVAIAFETSDTERLRIDSSGRLLVGTSTSPSVGDSQYSLISILGSTAGSTTDAYFSLRRGQAPASIASGSGLGAIVFGANDGSPYAAIFGQTDGTGGTNDYPGRLVFSTTADGASTPTERMRLDSSGRLGLGTTNPSNKLEVVGTSYFTDWIYTGSSSGSRGISSDSSIRSLLFGVNSGEVGRFDTSGRLLVGTSSSVTGGVTGVAKIQVLGNTSGTAAVLNLGSTSAAASIPSGSGLGYLSFSDNGAGQYAWIACETDGTGGTNDYPGRLVFSTTADGASSPTERIRIAQSGQVVIYGPGGGTFLNLANSGGYSGLHEVNNTAYTIGQNSDVRTMRIGSGANWLTTGVNLAPGGTSWGTYSDERLKTDIVELDSCLESIKNIRCISYRLTNVDEPDSKKRLGVIAQDLVGKYDETINRSRRSEDDETEYLSVQYTDLVPVLLKALQEATTKIETLEAKVAALESV